MTPERIAELNLLTIPPVDNTPESERNSSYRDRLKKINFEWQLSTLGRELRGMYPFMQIYYCRRQNGSLTFTFVYFPNRNAQHRQFFYNTNLIELGTITKWLELQILQLNNNNNDTN